MGGGEGRGLSFVLFLLPACVFFFRCALGGFSCLFFLLVSFVSFPGALSFSLCRRFLYLWSLDTPPVVSVVSLVLFLASFSCFLVHFWHFLSPLGFVPFFFLVGLCLAFSLRHSIILSFPLPLPRFLFFPISFVLFSIFSASLFRCSCSLRAFLLPFGCSHSIILSFGGILFIFWWLSLCYSCSVSPFSGSSPSIFTPFSFFHRLCAGMCVVPYSFLFLITFRLVCLASGILCLPFASFAASCFFVGFFCSFRLFLVRAPVVFPS